MGVQDHLSREEKLLRLRVCTAGRRHSGTLVSAGLSCLLGLRGVSGKVLGSASLLLTHSGPQSSLGWWGEPSSGIAGRSCCWHMVVESLSPRTWAGGQGRILVASKLKDRGRFVLCSRFFQNSCVIASVAVCLVAATVPSHRAALPWLYDQARLPALGLQLPFATCLSPGGPQGLQLCLRCPLFNETFSGHSA